MMWRVWIMWAAVASLMLGLEACATDQAPEPVVRVVTVSVPVPTPCVSDRTPAAPKYSATVDDLKHAKGGKRYTMAVAGFLERDQRLSELEPLVAACRK